MKNEDATYKTTSALLAVARKHFTEYGYFEVSLEKIAEEENVTRGAVYHHFKNKQGLFIAVLECVQKDVSIQIENEAMKSNDPWQQLILGCVGFVKGANTNEDKRLLFRRKNNTQADAQIGIERKSLKIYSFSSTHGVVIQAKGEESVLQKVTVSDNLS